MSTARRPRPEREERRATRQDPAEPIWTRPEPGARRASYTREQIAATAIAVADAEGFEAVSMRRVARELGAGTMTLYHYVRTKDDLVTLMDDALMSEILVPDDELPLDDWRTALTEISTRTRAVFKRHPWSLKALGESSGGPNGMRHLEQSLAAVARTGLDERGQLELITLVDDYVFGYVMRELLIPAKHDPTAMPPAIAQFFADLLASGDYPHIQRFIGDEEAVTGFMRFVEVAADPGRFERGLQRLLDGVELQLTQNAAAQSRGGPARRTRTAGSS
ncbi:MAG: TetR/AcrR family transcriptional regulator [Conexibacter sp.]